MSESFVGRHPLRPEPNRRENSTPGTDAMIASNRRTSMTLDIGLDFVRERFDVSELVGENAVYNAEIDLFILMDDKIAESHHRDITRRTVDHSERLPSAQDSSRCFRPCPSS